MAHRPDILVIKAGGPKQRPILSSGALKMISIDRVVVVVVVVVMMVGVDVGVGALEVHLQMCLPTS